MDDCAIMLQILVEARIPLTAKSLEPPADGIIYHATEQMGQMGSPLLFNDINDESFKCVAVVAQPYIDTMLNVYVGSAVVFQHYERLLTSLFPTPHCPNMIFNLPAEFQSIFYLKFPRILAIFLDSYVVNPMICTQLVHDDASPNMPASFADPLRLFGRMFTTKLDTQVNSRPKRGSSSFDNFLSWVFGDTPQRVYNLETLEMRHLKKINNFIDQSFVKRCQFEK